MQARRRGCSWGLSPLDGRLLDALPNDLTPLLPVAEPSTPHPLHDLSALNLAACRAAGPPAALQTQLTSTPTCMRSGRRAVRECVRWGTLKLIYVKLIGARRSPSTPVCSSNFLPDFAAIHNNMEPVRCIPPVLHDRHQWLRQRSRLASARGRCWSEI
ncbi:hypothetical protein PMIN01_05198 [Paraphaeosphaeria minitans]|uniref:Uncharacterized protein n=1 Tax=Paraphaeosphaeria minitans TaxID=565426 RepID=A0A9P6GNP9_9PLEO|nr:hypothetical protein PMIN01_05198 [Paraphaeosphaeria minitans]